MIRDTACSRLAEREITTGDLPPSSSVTGTRLRAAAVSTCRAMLVAPVKIMWSKGSEVKACPTSGPPQNVVTSVGSKASATMSSITLDVSGVNSDGLIIARLPAARMPASGWNTIDTGKFQGATIPTTPLGWYWMCERPPSSPSGKVDGRFSFFIHFLRCLRQCFIEPIDAATSVIRLIWSGLQTKSLLIASLIRPAWRTSTSMARLRRSIRTSAETKPSCR